MLIDRSEGRKGRESGSKLETHIFQYPFTVFICRLIHSTDEIFLIISIINEAAILVLVRLREYSVQWTHGEASSPSVWLHLWLLVGIYSAFPLFGYLCQSAPGGRREEEGRGERRRGGGGEGRRRGEEEGGGGGGGGEEEGGGGERGRRERRRGGGREVLRSNRAHTVP